MYSHIQREDTVHDEWMDGREKREERRERGERNTEKKKKGKMKEREGGTKKEGR